MNLAQRSFALIGFSVAAWILAGPTTAYGGHRHGSHGSSGGSYGSHGSSGGSYGSSGGSSGGSYGSHGSSGGSYGSHGSSGGSSGGEVISYSSSDTEQRAWIVLTVPADAMVYFQDQPTTSTGTRRRFRSPVLEQDKAFVYTIRVELQRDGQLVSNTQQPRVSAGSRVELDFAEAEQGAGLVASLR